MSEIAWFTLLVRAMGLLIIVQLVPGFIGFIGYLPSVFSTDMPAPPLFVLAGLASGAGYVASIGVGLYLFFNGRRVVRFCVRDLIARCAVCGYPLAKITGSVCPECGVPIQRPAQEGRKADNDQESS